MLNAIKIKSFFILLSIFCFSLSHSAKFVTISSGNWNSPSSWQGGLAPSFNCTDSVYINNYIIFNSTLTLTSYLKIDSTGTLCGHERINLYGGNSYNYGTIQCDSLMMNQCNFYSYGTLIIKYYGQLWSAGSYFYNNGSLAVGPDFTCGEKNEIGIKELEESTEITIYPQPALLNEEITITLPENSQTGFISVINSIGETVFSSARITEQKISFSHPGTYLLLFTSKNKKTRCRKLIVLPNN
jgi:hypothetical protein